MAQLVLIYQYPKGYVYQDTDELGQPPASFGLDEDLPFTAGVQRVFYPPPAAVLDDEILPSWLAGIEDEGAFVAQFQRVWTPPPVADIEDDILPVNLLGIDEDPAWIANRAGLPRAPIVFVDDEAIGFAAALGIDDDPGPNFVPARFAATPTVFVDDEQIPFWVAGIDEDVAPPVFPRRTGAPPVVFIDDEQLAVSATFGLDDDPWWMSPQAPTRVGVTIGIPDAEQLPFWLAGIEDDAPAVPAPQSTAKPAAVFSDDESLGFAAATFALDDDAGWILVPQPRPGTVPGVVQDDEQLAFWLGGLEEPSVWLPQYQSVARNAVVVAEDTAPPAWVAGIDDDVAWIPRYQAYARPPAAFSSDEVPGFIVATLGIDDDAGWTPQYQITRKPLYRYPDGDAEYIKQAAILDPSPERILALTALNRVFPLGKWDRSVALGTTIRIIAVPGSSRVLAVKDEEF